MKFQFDFIKYKFVFFGISIAFIVFSIIMFFARGGFNGGLNMDIQFKGGTIIEFVMKDEQYDVKKAVEIVENLTHKKVNVNKSTTYDPQGKSEKVNIMMVEIANSNEALSNDELEKVITEIINTYGLEQDRSKAVRNQQTVAPFIGDEMRNNGIKATIVLSILIVIYIWIRFQVMSGLAAGVMAVLALLHDAAIMLGVYIVFQVPMNESFIAAVLTILGYSMNDTIIIYDRIRENNTLLKKTPVAELVNKSIIQTLNRSINTVVTVLICVITVLVFANIYSIKSLSEFSFPLTVGIASGCYSSIFIASPLYVMWKEYKENKDPKANIKGSKTKPSKA